MGANAAGFDRQLALNLILLGVVFVVVHAAMAVTLWPRRTRTAAPVLAAAFAQPPARVDLLWAALAAVLFFGLQATSLLQGGLLHGAGMNGGKGPDQSKDAHGRVVNADAPVRVEVTAEQFRWYFRYPGADDVFGKTEPKLIDAAEGNPLGIDRRDAAAEDDRVSATLVVPAGREVELTLRAHDVIHSFFVPELRFKQDAVPGMEVKVSFRAIRTGNFDIACAELCGLGHYKMNALLKVVSEDDYQRWLANGDSK